MPNTLRSVESPADVRLNVETFNSEAARYFDRAARLLRLHRRSNPSSWFQLEKIRLTRTR